MEAGVHKRRKASGPDLDPVTFEVLRYSFDSITDEILVTIIRGAHTSLIRDALDVSVGLFDSHGAMVAQGFSIPFHLGAIPDAVAAVIEKFAGDFAADDVYMLNDPYTGGMHLPDIFLIKPVFAEDKLLAFMVTVADFGDVGGRVPGGRPLDARSVFEEGIRLPPMKFIDAGRENTQIREIIGQNVRLPDQTLADLDVCLAALRAGERALTATLVRFGLDDVRRFMAVVQQYTEGIVRSVIADFPDGRYEFEDYVDDGVTVPEPITIRVALDVVGDQLVFDFAGSSPQIPASLNTTVSWVKSAVYAAVRTLMPRGLPNNEGLFRAITVNVPLGTILNPLPPAAVAERGLTGFRIVDAVQGVLAQVAPGQIPAAGEGGACAFHFAGKDASGESFIAGDSVMGAWGGRPDRDGVDGISNFAANASNRPIEILEVENAVRILRYGFVADSAGPGRFRGGLSIEREWEMLCDEALCSSRVDRCKFAPWGLHGGEAGAKGRLSSREGSDGWSERAGKGHFILHRNDRLLLQQASAGGYGDPLERDPEAVLRDWRDDKVTREHALRAYGVAIDVAKACVDPRETARVRRDLKRSHGRKEAAAR